MKYHIETLCFQAQPHRLQEHRKLYYSLLGFVFSQVQTIFPPFPNQTCVFVNPIVSLIHFPVLIATSPTEKADGLPHPQQVFSLRLQANCDMWDTVGINSLWS